MKIPVILEFQKGWAYADLLTILLYVFAGLMIGSLSVAQASRSVTLAWDPSPSPLVAGYQVYYGTSSDTLAQSLDVGSSLVASISDLDDNQTYFFVVIDYTSSGFVSPPSNMVVLNDSTERSRETGTPTLRSAAMIGGTASAGLLWRNTSSGAIGLWSMQGTSVSGTQLLGQVDPSWKIVGIGNFDGAGSNDILWYNAQLGLVAIWTMNGGTRVGNSVLSGGSPDWDVIAVADFDHTGFSDILWRQKSSGDLYLWKCVAPARFSHIFVASVDPTWRLSGVADVEGSGSPDLVWRNPNTGGLAIWQLVKDRPG